MILIHNRHHQGLDNSADDTVMFVIVVLNNENLQGRWPTGIAHPSSEE